MVHDRGYTAETRFVSYLLRSMFWHYRPSCFRISVRHLVSVGVTRAALPVYKYLVSVSNLTKWRDFFLFFWVTSQIQHIEHYWKCDVVVVILLLWIETSTSNAMLKKPLYGWSDVSMNFVFAQNMDMFFRFLQLISSFKVTVLTVWVIYKTTFLKIHYVSLCLIMIL